MRATIEVLPQIDPNSTQNKSVLVEQHNPLGNFPPLDLTLRRSFGPPHLEIKNPSRRRHLSPLLLNRSKTNAP